MVVEYKMVPRHLPASLKRKCPDIWRKAGGPAVTGDYVDRGDVNEAGLIVCAARMNKVIEWDQQGGLAKPGLP